MNYIYTLIFHDAFLLDDINRFLLVKKIIFKKDLESQLFFSFFLKEKQNKK